MRKDLSPYFGLSRSVAINHFESLKAYSSSNLLTWAAQVGKYVFSSKHPYKTWGASDGIFRMANMAKISLAGDWGSGTDEAAMVGIQIRNFEPDYTIHLGDIYYVGSSQEINENFLGWKQTDYTPVTFPPGSNRSFSLLGNHDMYSNGEAYFDKLLPALAQEASFFLLQNDHFVVVGLDTGYNSAGPEFGPIAPSCKFPDAMYKWLHALGLATDPRRIVLLSHHGPFSSFERAYPQPARQLSTVINKPVIWFWGHEHRFVAYQDQETVQGLKVNGRCIGHGGMPVEFKKRNENVRRLITDDRLYPNNEGLKVGFNGHANLTFNGATLKVDYMDLNGEQVYSEIL